MDFSVIIAFASAVLSAGIALAVGWSERRSIAHWAFMAGIAILATESVFVGLTSLAESQPDILYWQSWKFLALSMLPGTWLFFSLTYARSNYREFLKRWRFTLVAAFVLPVALATLFRRNLVISLQRPDTGDNWFLGLGVAGFF